MQYFLSYIKIIFNVREYVPFFFVHQKHEHLKTFQSENKERSSYIQDHNSPGPGIYQHDKINLSQSIKWK